MLYSKLADQKHPGLSGSRMPSRGMAYCIWCNDVVDIVFVLAAVFVLAVVLAWAVFPSALMGPAWLDPSWMM